MTLVAAAVCPQPPLLVPEVARGESVAVREPAVRVTRQLVAYDPDLIVVVGDAPHTVGYPQGDAGTLAGFGVPVSVTLGRPVGGSRPATLPLSVTLGAWLLEQASWAGDAFGFGVNPTTTAAEADRIGAELAHRADRVALLVMGDGSARRTPAAPGGFDERAAAHDHAAASALADADARALLRLDPELSRDLMAAGRAPWQVLAGASLASTPPDTHRCSWTSRAEYVDAPYGVGYVVAFWEWGGPDNALDADGAALRSAALDLRGPRGAALGFAR